jgi:hypothetical protein
MNGSARALRGLRSQSHLEPDSLAAMVIVGAPSVGDGVDNSDAEPTHLRRVDLADHGAYGRAVSQGHMQPSVRVGQFQNKTVF